MNVIDDYDYVSTFDYPSEKTETSEQDTSSNTAHMWLDDLGWI